MNRAVRDFIIGLASIVAVLGLAVLLMYFGELDAWFNPRYPVTVHLNDAGGLRPGSRVELNGVQVGHVDSLAVVPATADGTTVVVRTLIEEGTSIPADSGLRIQVALIGGSSILQILSPPLADGAVAAALPADGSGVLTGQYLPLIEEVAAMVDERVEPLRGSLENLERLSDTYVTLGDNLNELVGPQTPEDLEAGAEPNLRTVIARFNGAVDDIRVVLGEDVKRTLSLADDWLADESIRDNARKTVEAARNAVERIGTTLDRYDRLADTLAKDADEIVGALTPVADDLSLTLGEIRRLTLLAREGDGTVARLLQRPDLHDGLLETATQLERMLVELRLVLQKLRSEGLQLNP